LIQKGIASSVIKNKIKYFHSANPTTIPALLQERARRIKEVLPELLAIRESIEEKPKVQVYEGIKGIKTLLEDVLTENKEILHYGDIISLQDSLRYIFPQFINRRIQKKIPIKIICKKEEIHADLIKTARKSYRKFSFIPKGFVFKSSIFIYKRKVVILNLQKEPHYGIMIDNKDFYDTQKNLVELLIKLSEI